MEQRYQNSDIQVFLSQQQEYPVAESICRQLIKNGFLAYLAGGCVRDALLKQSPQDFDVVTDASVEDIEKIFAKSIPVGKDFGVVRVLQDGVEIEVAQFREESDYKDGRHPSLVRAATPEKDAERRDFTVNALFWDLESHQVIDFVGGLDDLKNRCLRTVGLAQVRFQEDHLRLLRAVRFHHQLDFRIEPMVWRAIQENADLIKTVSGERVQEELNKIFRKPMTETSWKCLLESGLLEALFGLSFSWCPVAPVNPGTQDQSWALFFHWLSQMNAHFLNENHLPRESIMERLRFSRPRQRFIKTFFQTLEDLSKKPQSLGEILYFCFEEASLWALQISVSLQKNELISRALQIYDKDLLQKKPEALVKAQDLPSQIKGPEIGQALMRIYLRQLEGLVKSKQDGLDWLKKAMK